MSDIEAMLSAAASVVAAEPSCWLVTRDRSGLPYARPMGNLPVDPASFGWCLRFLVDRRSGKSGDVATEPRVTVLFQRGEDAYVSLMGTARLVTLVAEVAARWIPAYDTYFPPGRQRDNAGFIEVDVSTMNLWIRGVTPEPFGMRTTELSRTEQGNWVPGTPAGIR